MAYEFKKLGEVEALEDVPDGANALIEVDGAIKRVPGTGLGGGGGIKTAIIKSSDYDNTLAGLQTTAQLPDPVTYSCINMTFEEAYATMAAGEPLAVMMMLGNGNTTACMPCLAVFAGDVLIEGIPLIGIQPLTDDGDELYWTADGLSTTISGGE